jgi:serine/threonine protein phosphatase PrpC
LKIGEIARKRDAVLARLGLGRSANDQVILGEPSPMNAKTWWTSGYHKVHLDLPRSSVEYDFGTCGDLAVFGATSRGTKHQFRAAPNQDAFSFCSIESPAKYLAIAVCDGVSQAKFSSYGSRRLARETVLRLERAIRDNISQGTELAQAHFVTILRESSTAMKIWSATDLDAPHQLPEETDYRELSSTIALVLVNTTQTDEAGYRVRAAFVGDSPIYVSSDTAYTIQTPFTKGGDLVENSTNALPVKSDEPVRPGWIDTHIPAGSHLLIATDGFSNALRGGNTKHARVLRMLWSSPTGPVALALNVTGIDFDRRGEDDDRTAVIVWAPPFLEHTTDHHGSTIDRPAAPTSPPIKP